MSRYELFTHTAFISFLLLIVLLPLYHGASLASANTQYSYVHGYFSDYYSYLSYIRQGAIQYYQTNQFTTENPKPTWTHVFYLLLGRVGSFFNASPMFLYHATIIISLILFYFFTYALVKLVVQQGFRLLALGFIFLASPIGLTASSVFWTRMDIYSRHSLAPHHFVSTTLFIASIYYLFRYIKDKNLKLGIVSGITNAVGTFFLNIPGLIFFLTLIGTTLLTRVKRNVLPGIFLIILAAIAVQLLVFKIHTSARPTRLDQLTWEYEHHRAETYPATFSVYVLSYGILLLFIPFSLPALVKSKRFDYFFILFATLLPPLLYLASISGLIHINKLRFAYSAPYVFGGILAAIGVKTITDLIKSVRARRFLLFLVALLILSSSISGLLNHWYPWLLKSKTYKNVYLPKGHLRAIKYLDSFVPRYTKVMTTWVSGGFIPAFSYLRVFIGHELLTPNLWEKWEIADNFYRGQLTVDEAKKVLKENEIEYVLWDIGPFVEKYNEFLIQLFTDDGIIVYKVDKI